MRIDRVRGIVYKARITWNFWPLAFEVGYIVSVGSRRYFGLAARLSERNLIFDKDFQTPFSATYSLRLDSRSP